MSILAQARRLGGFGKQEASATPAPDANTFQQYLSAFQEVPGYFTKEAMIAWDFFLTTQAKIPIGGHFLEIGVLNGKSATLASMYLSDTEKAVLIDINPCQEALDRVASVKSSGVEFFQTASHAAKHERTITDLAGKYRFIHIDGDHSGYNVTNDLIFAADVMKEDGIICMDDFFNPIYPQVTAAIYKFLFDNPLTMKMVLCGGNKCFLVKASSYRLYENLIRSYYMDHGAMNGLNISLHKSTYSHDMGCFSMWSEHDRKAFGLTFSQDDRRVIGIDADNNDIVF
jgi:ubiquinone/menaquinone biosynthesis C-methylase UbiE